MLTYELHKAPGLPLYESLYRCIRGDILSGKLPAGEKLPSKRALAAHLEVSKVTVEGAYDQLVSEGYLQAREKVGYFVEAVEHPMIRQSAPADREAPAPVYPVDLTSNAPAAGFPFSVWMKLQREVMLDYGNRLLAPLPSQGYPELRQAIADHLAAFRNMQVDPGNILVGAGTDFLYNLLIQLLGRDSVYAVEDPGYQKIRKICAAAGVSCLRAPMDDQGVRPDALAEARVLHCTPSHHFPTGIVMSFPRRRALLDWAGEAPGRWIIEDDYDSEFRFHAHPLPSLHSLDRSGRVIYMNTFSKSLAPSIRIGYMILPPALMERYRRTLGFYSCTVPSFEQYTLARFLARGHFEKHINRMRKFYRSRRNRVIGMLEGCPFASGIRVLEKDAGLHFLLQVRTERSDRELTDLMARAGIRITPLSDYYLDDAPPAAHHCLVVNYSGLAEENLPGALRKLAEILETSPSS